METAAALAVVAPLTFSGYSNLRDCFRPRSHGPVIKAACPDPTTQLRIVGAQGGVLGGRAALSIDGQKAGNYLVFNGEVLLVGNSPEELHALTAVGGARVTAKAQTVSVATWEAPREMTLQFETEEEAQKWAGALQEASKLPKYPVRLEALMEHIHEQDMHIGDLEVRVQKLTEDHEKLEKQHVEEHTHMLVKAVPAIEKIKAAAVYLVGSGDPKHQAHHPGLAYRWSTKLEDKADEYAVWGTTVTGIDLGNGWLRVGKKFLPMNIGDINVLSRYNPDAGTFGDQVSAVKAALQNALQKKDGTQDRGATVPSEVRQTREIVIQPGPGPVESHPIPKAVTGTSKEALAAMLEVTEAQKNELEERARTLEDRMDRLGDRSQEAQEETTPPGFVFDANENKELLRMIQMAEARRTELEDRARELEVHMERLCQPQQVQEPLESSTLQLEQQVLQLEADLAEKDRKVIALQQQLASAQRGVDTTPDLAYYQQLADEQNQRLLQLDQSKTEMQQAYAEQLGDLRFRLARFQEQSDTSGVEQDLLDQLAEAKGQVTSLQNALTDKLRDSSMLENSVKELSGQLQEHQSLAEVRGKKVIELQNAILDMTQDMRRQLRDARRESPQDNATEDPSPLAQVGSRQDSEVLAKQLAESHERMLVLQAANETQIQRVVQLESLLSGTQEALFQQAAEAEARTAELQDALANKEELLAQLTAGTTDRGQAPFQIQPDHDQAESQLLELSALVREKDGQIQALSSAVATLEEELVPLRAAPAPATSDLEALSERVQVAESRAGELQVLCVDQDKQLLKLQEALASAKKELRQQITATDAHIAQFQSAAATAEHKLAEQKQWIEAAEQELAAQRGLQPGLSVEELEALQQRTVEAEAGTRQAQAIIEENNLVMMQLKQDYGSMAQAHQVAKEDLVQQAAAAEAQLQRAAAAEANLLQVESLIEEKDRLILQLREEAASMGQELTRLTHSRDAHETVQQDLMEQRALAEAQLRRTEAADAEVAHAQGLLSEKDRRILELEQDVISLQRQHQQVRDAASQQSAVTEAHMKAAREAEALAAHFRAAVEEKARHIEKLESSSTKLLEEVTQLRAAAAERVEKDRAGKQGFLLQARAAEDLAKSQGRQEQVDEVRRRFEEEKAALQRQLEGHFEIEYAAIRGEAAESRRGLEALSVERDTLKSQLEQVQAKDSQRIRFLEDEKSNMKRHLVEQFENEYATIRKQTVELQRELQNTIAERDALKNTLEVEQQANSAADRSVTEGDFSPAVVQRLASTEIAAEEAKAKLGVVEQELMVAYQTIERQSQEHAEMRLQRLQADEIQVQLTRVEQEKVALQEQLAQRTASYNRELEDVGVKMKLLEEALIAAGGFTDGALQQAATVTSQTVPVASDAVTHSTPVGSEVSSVTRQADVHLPWMACRGGSPGAPGAPSQAVIRHRASTGLQPTVPHIGEVPHLQASPPYARIPSLQGVGVSPPPNRGLSPTAAVAPPVGALQLQAQALPPTSMAVPNTGPPVSPISSYAAPVQVASVQTAPAPMQNLIVPGGLVSPVQVRVQEVQGPKLAMAARQLQLASPLVSPARQRPQEHPVSMTLLSAALQRAGSPAMRRPNSTVASPVQPVLQTSATIPVSRAPTSNGRPMSFLAPSAPRPAVPANVPPTSCWTEPSALVAGGPAGAPEPLPLQTVSSGVFNSVVHMEGQAGSQLSPPGTTRPMPVQSRPMSLDLVSSPQGMEKLSPNGSVMIS